MRKREKKERKIIEQDPLLREQTVARFALPEGTKEFRQGYMECIQMYALHMPNKRQVARILDEYCITLEQECLRSMVRENVAQYEGYRQAMKELRRMKLIQC